MYEIFDCIHPEEIYFKDVYAFGGAEYANNFFWKNRKLRTQQIFGKIFVWDLQIILLNGETLRAQSKILEILEKYLSESFKSFYLSLQTWRNFNKIVINWTLILNESSSIEWVVIYAEKLKIHQKKKVI